MGEVVNLNQYRKQRDRSERKKTAAANRARFGRGKDELARTEKERAREDADLDGKLLHDRTDSDDAPEAG
jgi:hypothetical protein